MPHGDLAGTHRKKKRRLLTLLGGCAVRWLTNYRSVIDHGCLKASRASGRDRTAPLAAGAVSRDPHSARRGGRLPVEPQTDEGNERERGAENTRRQRQSRAGPRRRGTSQQGAGQHGTAARSVPLLHPLPIC